MQSNLSPLHQLAGVAPARVGERTRHTQPNGQKRYDEHCAHKPAEHIDCVEGAHVIHRAIEIQTGYGLEGDLPDALLKRIINNYMLPAFRERDWDRGMTEGVAAIAGVLNGRPPAELSEDDGGAIGMLFFFFGVPLLVIIIALVFAGRCPRCHKRTLKRVGTEVISRTRNEVVEETT